MTIKVTSDIYDLSIDVTKWSEAKIIRMLKHFRKRQIDTLAKGEYLHKLKIEITNE